MLGCSGSPYSAQDLSDSNKSGSTLFMPVCDVSRALISLIAQFVDPGLRRYALPSDGWNPAGTHRIRAGSPNWQVRYRIDRAHRGSVCLMNGATIRDAIDSNTVMTAEVLCPKPRTDIGGSTFPGNCIGSVEVPHAVSYSVTHD